MGQLAAEDGDQVQCGGLNTWASVSNQVHTISGPDYGYDAAGNMTHDATTGNNYSYDAENRIIGAAGYTYTYDADGNRVEKSNGSTGTIYWDMTPGVVAESDLAGALKSEYVFFDGERVARKDLPGNTVSYYFSDHLKTASVITSSTGIITEDEDYYPWGGELQFVNNDSNHYKFTSKERDSETQLDYFGARYYGNWVGRFLTPDWAAKAAAVPYANFSNPQSLNLYTYGVNNPKTFGDPDGHLIGDCGIECGTDGWGGLGWHRHVCNLCEDAPKNPDGTPAPPPVQVPGAPNAKWKWAPDAQNPRGGTWKPDSYPSTPGGIPGASWDPFAKDGKGPGHWDVDDGNRSRQRYDKWGRPLTPDEAHDPNRVPTPPVVTPRTGFFSSLTGTISNFWGEHKGAIIVTGAVILVVPQRSQLEAALGSSSREPRRRFRQ